MKQLISRRSFLKAAGVTAAAASMAIGAPAASACWYGDKSDVTIQYTNDVHTYIDKQSPKLTYAAIADLKQSYQNAGKDVLLVDAGDHVQGTAYGSMDEGASIIKLMNAAGYDVATPGNHEFDYGMDRAKAIMKEADFPYLSCNWVDLRTTLRVLPSVKAFARGGRRIAFVGVTTPETFTKSTPAYFMDKAQRKYIYDIQGGEDGKKLYDAVQKAIDKAKLLADVVIGLGGSSIKIGEFVNSVINFLIVAFVLFVVIKFVNSLHRKPEEPAEPEEPTTKVCPYCQSEISIKAVRCPHCTSKLEGFPEMKA